MATRTFDAEGDVKKLLKLIEERGALIAEGRKMTEDIEDIERKRATIGMKVQKVRDKMEPFINSLLKKDLGEFEDIASMDVKDGKLVVEIFDWVEKYKEAFREKRDKK